MFNEASHFSIQLINAPDAPFAVFENFNKIPHHISELPAFLNEIEKAVSNGEYSDYNVVVPLLQGEGLWQLDSYDVFEKKGQKSVGCNNFSKSVTVFLYYKPKSLASFIKNICAQKIETLFHPPDFLDWVDEVVMLSPCRKAKTFIVNIPKKDLPPWLLIGTSSMVDTDANELFEKTKGQLERKEESLTAIRELRACQGGEFGWRMVEVELVNRNGMNVLVNYYEPINPTLMLELEAALL